ncbi:MAG: phospholipase [Roseibium sp.]|uniref:luciferase domain-containing protein n=1 Tax=Roseibium sp. TaxID=1936156 RepID=UPI001B1F7142|nr:luciferase family protein [Roseibium sp.]MBO6507859.1 phospholipase [Roseibium sp.]MBO6894778.1 phospholipase [Roseibium sp.]MBO6929415.1 phospholipase [Roseibium sp.]
MPNLTGPVFGLTGVLALLGIVLGSALAAERGLPERDGPPPRTTAGVPHIQIGAQVVPALSQNLLDRVAAIPGVKLRATVISLPGAKGFWLSEELDLARPQAIVGGREFAHLHPDGSLHASLPPKRARDAVKAGWATMHPWADSRPGWEGFVLLYTPRTMAETDVTFGLIVDGYNYVTGRNYHAPER